MTIKNEKTEEKKKDEIDIGEKVSANQSTDDHSWGTDMYPERKGAKLQRSWFKTLIGAEGRESLDNAKCEANVYYCIKNSE